MSAWLIRALWTYFWLGLPFCVALFAVVLAVFHSPFQFFQDCERPACCLVCFTGGVTAVSFHGPLHGLRKTVTTFMTRYEWQPKNQLIFHCDQQLKLSFAR